MAKGRGLSPAELRLWAAYSETITLLPGRTRLPVEPLPPPPPTPAPAAPIIRPAIARAAPPSLNVIPAGLDKSTWNKFSAGKIRATARLDLHGHTAARAHHAVTHFIEHAYADQTRCVEIITGKGEILAYELPHWLAAPRLRPLILAIAHPHAANTGSVRILLRRIR
jgi:DNA-nicking Smr family endonuclease